jgi:hypothetical protein
VYFGYFLQQKYDGLDVIKYMKINWTQPLNYMDTWNLKMRAIHEMRVPYFLAFLKNKDVLDLSRIFDEKLLFNIYITFYFLLNNKYFEWCTIY